MSMIYYIFWVAFGLVLLCGICYIVRECKSDNYIDRNWNIINTQLKMVGLILIQTEFHPLNNRWAIVPIDYTHSKDIIGKNSIQTISILQTINRNTNPTNVCSKFQCHDKDRSPTGIHLKFREVGNG